MKVRRLGLDLDMDTLSTGPGASTTKKLSLIQQVEFSAIISFGM